MHPSFPPEALPSITNIELYASSLSSSQPQNPQSYWLSLCYNGPTAHKLTCCLEAKNTAFVCMNLRNSPCAFNFKAKPWVTVGALPIINKNGKNLKWNATQAQHTVLNTHNVTVSGMSDNTTFINELPSHVFLCLLSSHSTLWHWHTLTPQLLTQSQINKQVEQNRTHSRRNSNWMWMVFEQVSWWSTNSYCYSSWVWVKSRGIFNQYRLYTYTDFRDLPIAVNHSEWDSFQAIQLPNQKSEWFWQLLGTQTRIKFPLFTLNTTAPSIYINILL